MYKTDYPEIKPLQFLMGEAMFKIQLLEDAISHSITLKKDVRHPRNMLKKEANEFLEKHRSYTLGKAINIAKKIQLYPDVLQTDLETFLTERNWLVHKCVPYNIDDIYIPSRKDDLFHRIKNISNKATMLQQAIETDLIEFSESIGMDMSKVRAIIVANHLWLSSNYLMI